MKTVDGWYEYFYNSHNNPSPYELIEEYKLVYNVLKKYIRNIEYDCEETYTQKEKEILSQLHKEINK